MPNFVRLVGYDSAAEKENALLSGGDRYLVAQKNFSKMPGYPIAYWVSPAFLRLFDFPSIGNSATPRQGLITGSVDRFVRYWAEVSLSKTNLERKNTNTKWVSYNYGGTYRKWYGNREKLVLWEDDGCQIKAFADDYGNQLSRPQNCEYYFKSGITWTAISTSIFAARYQEADSIFSNAGMAIFPYQPEVLCFLNSKVALKLLNILNPTLNYGAGTIGDLPNIVSKDISNRIVEIAADAIAISKADWDSRECSWNFSRSPLLTDYRNPPEKATIDGSVDGWRWPSAFMVDKAISLNLYLDIYKSYWTSLVTKMKDMEEKVNQVFIDSYGLQGELVAKVPYSEISILSEELCDDARKDDSIKFVDKILAQQFVSYGVGCIMGRYSVEKDGLILADEGTSVEDFRAKVHNALYLPDKDAILPFTDEDDFSDDLPTAFKKWLQFVSGIHYETNLRWIAESLGKDLRSYFDKDFYKDHIKRYKARPVYWMISSPSGFFRALVYLHRYSKDTVGKVLNDYVRPYRNKIAQKLRGLETIIDSSDSSAGEKTKAKKRLVQLEKYRTEIEAWEKESLYPLALKRVELDLDDGVKVNYKKLEGILEPVKQLEAKDEG